MNRVCSHPFRNVCEQTRPMYLSCINHEILYDWEKMYLDIIKLGVGLGIETLPAVKI